MRSRRPGEIHTVNVSFLFVDATCSFLVSFLTTAELACSIIELDEPKIGPT